MMRNTTTVRPIARKNLFFRSSLGTMTSVPVQDLTRLLSQSYQARTGRSHNAIPNVPLRYSQKLPVVSVIIEVPAASLMVDGVLASIVLKKRKTKIDEVTSDDYVTMRLTTTDGDDDSRMSSRSVSKAVVK